MNVLQARPSTKSEVIQILGTPGSHYDIIEETPFSTVAKAWTTITDGEPRWIVVKSSSTVPRFSREPHDIVKEVRLMSTILTPNIVCIIGSFQDQQDLVQNIYMPYLPISLEDLLSSPFFSPHPFPPLRVPDEDARRLQEATFCTLAKSIMRQIICAVAYLHSDSRRIAHRDIKPGNIMLTKDGCVKLIDFGVSFCEKEDEAAKEHDLWPETSNKLYFEVSTGLPKPFVVPKYLRIGYPGAQWIRKTLFNGDRGEIGLAWSIFKIFGTPDSESWPEFEELPGAKSVVFNEVPPVPLAPLLPNLPPSTLRHPILDDDHDEAPANQLPTPSTSPKSESSSSSSTSSRSITRHPRPTPLDLIRRFLVYPSNQRLTAQEALTHGWFSNELTTAEADKRGIPKKYQSMTMLPHGYPEEPGARLGKVSQVRGVKRKRDDKVAAKTRKGGSALKASGGKTEACSGNQQWVLEEEDGEDQAVQEDIVDLEDPALVYEWKGKTLGEWLASVLLTIPAG
ncbi:hypothetical protein CVT24_011707 [Panaeolus cyanescens]|uniref:Protein kinase domain-containing protein n=1 Tax=Panaeolus cyanescens TaxID=181874 RepID=A0A409YH65_9AGAR|nr:hypothetical protein CVT24_011707 [Panaeolus cyanescens]